MNAPTRKEPASIGTAHHRDHDQLPDAQFATAAQLLLSALFGWSPW